MPHTQNTTNLIPISQLVINAESTQTFDARHLHSSLAVRKDFSNWIKAQIRRARLVENRDYIAFTQKGERENQWVTAIEYHLTINAGKHICMISGTKKGWEVREYFIAKEQEAAKSSALDAYPELRALADMGKTIVALVSTTAENRAMAEQAQREAQEANTKADLALAQQLWMTIREYRYLHKLERQMPMSVCKAFGRYLTGHCLEKGVPVRDQGVVDKAWGKEHAYHVEVIAQLLPNWLKRHSRQIVLVPKSFL